MSILSNPSPAGHISGQLSIVIPAFNEEDGIIETLASLKEHLPEAEVIVVDDCSSDLTGERARERGARVVTHDFNKGYGGALKTGMLHATCRYVAWFDADNEHRAEDLKDMVERLQKEKQVAVIAVRTHPGRSALRNVGKWTIRMMARMLSVQMGNDVNCGLRVFRRTAILPYLNLLPNGYSASLTSTMTLIERGYPIKFHPIKLNPRIGVSKVKITDGFAALTLVLRMVMLFAPLRIFLRTGLVLVIMGAIYGVSVAMVVGLGIPPAALLLMLSGVLFSFLGLIADQISQMRLNQLTNHLSAVSDYSENNGQ